MSYVVKLLYNLHQFTRFKICGTKCVCSRVIGDKSCKITSPHFLHIRALHHSAQTSEPLLICSLSELRLTISMKVYNDLGQHDSDLMHFKGKRKHFYKELL